MCGRSRCTLAPDVIVQSVGADGWKGRELYNPTYNGAPGQWYPILLSNRTTHSKTLYSMKWGLKTAYTIDTGKVQINARAETLKQKKTFSKLLQSNRCVLVAEGYYEWAKTPSGKKQPYYFHSKKDEVLLFAALYTTSTSSTLSKIGETTPTEELEFTIITVEAPPQIRPIHDRMPAILSKEAAEKWLDPNGTVDAALTSLVPDVESLEWYPVSTKVNKTEYDAPDCSQKIEVIEEKDLYNWFHKKEEGVPMDITTKPHNVKDEVFNPIPVKQEPVDSNLKSLDSLQTASSEKHESTASMPLLEDEDDDEYWIQAAEIIDKEILQQAPSTPTKLKRPFLQDADSSPKRSRSTAEL